MSGRLLRPAATGLSGGPVVGRHRGADPAGGGRGVGLGGGTGGRDDRPGGARRVGRAGGLRIGGADLPERADVGEPGAEDVEQRAQHLGVPGLDGPLHLPQHLQHAHAVAVDVERQDERGAQPALGRRGGDRGWADAGEVGGEHRPPRAQGARQRAHVRPLLGFGEPQRAGVGRGERADAVGRVDQEEHRAADPEHPGDR